MVSDLRNFLIPTIKLCPILKKKNNYASIFYLSSENRSSGRLQIINWKKVVNFQINNV